MTSTVACAFAVILVPALVLGAPAHEWRDPNYHMATDEQLVVRQKDGGIRFGVDLGGSYRAEVRDGAGAGGGVRGVYSYLRPDGTPFTLAYERPSADAGYRPVPGGAAALPGVALPPFPHSLYSPGLKPRPYSGGSPALRSYGALAARDRMGERVKEDDDVVVIEPERNYYTPYVRIEGNSDEAPKGSDDEEYEVGDLDEVLVGEDDGPDEPIVGGVPLSEFNLPFVVPLKPGQALSEAVPSAVAIVGPFGFAHAAPTGAAVVGPHGVTFAAPSAEASAGNGGVALSQPSASAQAGFGGIAIAAGTAAAAAGMQTPVDGPPAPPAEDDTIVGEGVATRMMGPSNGYARPTSLNIYPIIANYYFGHQQQQQQPTSDPSSPPQYVPKTVFSHGRLQYSAAPAAAATNTVTAYSHGLGRTATSAAATAPLYSASSYEAFTQRRRNSHQ